MIDVAALFKDTDLTKVNDRHSASDVCQPMFSAWGVQYSSGNEKSDQTVFTKE